MTHHVKIKHIVYNSLWEDYYHWRCYHF